MLGSDTRKNPEPFMARSVFTSVLSKEPWVIRFWTLSTLEPVPTWLDRVPPMLSAWTMTSPKLTRLALKPVVLMLEMLSATELKAVPWVFQPRHSRRTLP